MPQVEFLDSPKTDIFNIGNAVGLVHQTLAEFLLSGEFILF